MNKYLFLLASLSLLASCNGLFTDDEDDYPEGYLSEWNYESCKAYLSEKNIWRAADEHHTLSWKLFSIEDQKYVDGPEVKQTGSAYEFVMPVSTTKNLGEAMLTIKPDVDIVTDPNKVYECIATIMVSQDMGYIWFKYYDIPNQDGQPVGWVNGTGTEGPRNGYDNISRSGADIYPVRNQPLLLQINFGEVKAGTSIHIKDITIRERTIANGPF